MGFDMYEIDMNRNYIDLHPETVVEEVLQNVRMILSTIMTEARYFNEFSLDGSLLDEQLRNTRNDLKFER